MTDEVRITNPETGGEKGRKLARFDLLPPKALWEVAEHYGVGASKYDDRNWERGYDWDLSFGALQRHAWAFWKGEDYDPETKTHHLAAVVFHAFALMTFRDTYPQGDTRPSRPSPIEDSILRQVEAYHADTAWFVADDRPDPQWKQLSFWPEEDEWSDSAEYWRLEGADDQPCPWDPVEWVDLGGEG